MKVNVLAIRPPKSDEKLREVTPELLASSLAKYSRSNKGIDAILDTIDWENPDESVDKIFKFVDYGHASIGGMTGGIPITIDGCSMFLAYKIFELSQLVDGQESSTRYIKMSTESLVDSEDMGIPEKLKPMWDDLMQESFAMYNKYYDILDAVAKETPEVMNIPKDTPEKVADRIRKNYALDRCRYFIPLATKTNASYIMTARVWAETIKQLESMPIKECQVAAKLIRAEVSKVAPRLMKHSYPDDASIYYAQRGVLHAIFHPIDSVNLQDKVWVKVDDDFPSFFEKYEDGDFEYKTNRYSTVSNDVKRTMVRFALNNIAIAELRDLNRHRSGNKYVEWSAVGFYIPKELESYREDIDKYLEKYSLLLGYFQEYDVSQDYEDYKKGHMITYYGFMLGTQVKFEHTLQLDKFIYEVELRTGLGAHFRYAEHMGKVAKMFLEQRPEYEPYINIGTAEPE